MTSAVRPQTTAPNDISELEPEFKIMLQATNRSPRTVGAYMAGVVALRAFLVERGMPTAVDAVAREHVEAFYAWMLETGYAAASVKNRHDGIRQFFTWCEEEGEVPEGKNPMRHVKSPRVPQNPPDVLREGRDPGAAQGVRRAHVRGSARRRDRDAALRHGPPAVRVCWHSDHRHRHRRPPRGHRDREGSEGTHPAGLERTRPGR